MVFFDGLCSRHDVIVLLLQTVELLSKAICSSLLVFRLLHLFCEHLLYEVDLDGALFLLEHRFFQCPQQDRQLSF